MESAVLLEPDQDAVTINYHAEPTPSRFHNDRTSRVRGIMGPIGSGKTVACVMDLFMKACEQKPGVGPEVPEPNVRRTRWGVFRNTYGDLRNTTIKTFKEWIPPRLCRIVYNAPIEGYMAFPLPDGTKVESEFLFASIDRPDDVHKVMSMELTGIWFNEARFMNEDVFADIDGRIGRYPSPRWGGWSWKGVLFDTNAPDMDHWWFRKFEEEKPDGWRLFKQPGALIQDANKKWVPNPLAENVKNHTDGYHYWTDQLPGKNPMWIRVMLGGQYGYLMQGKPVYDKVYNDTIHFSEEPLEILKGLPVHLGWDFGMCACLMGQMAPNGQLRILRECCATTRGGVKKFVREMVRPMWANTFGGMKLGTSTADPAGMQRGQVDGSKCIEALADMGIPTLGAPTNKIEARLEAMIEQYCFFPDGEPGVLVDPSCKVFRKGCLGGYHYERVNVSGVPRHHPEPAKTFESHIQDAGQYMQLGIVRGRTVGTGGTYLEQGDDW